MKGLLKFALALGVAVTENMSLTEILMAIKTAIALKTSTGNANQKKANKKEVDQLLVASAGKIQVGAGADDFEEFKVDDDVDAYLANFTDETEFNSELVIHFESLSGNDEVDDNYGLNSDGTVKAGFVRTSTKTNGERVFAISDFNAFNKSKEVYWEKAQMAVSAITRIDEILKGAKGDYSPIQISGVIYTTANPIGEFISLRTNSSYLESAQQLFVDAGLDVEDGLPVLGGKELYLTISVSASKAGDSVFSTNDTKFVGAVKAIAPEKVRVVRGKGTVYLKDRATSEQVSFQRILGITPSSQVALLNTYTTKRVINKADDESYAFRKTVDFQSASTNARGLGQMIKDLVAGGLSQEQAMQVAISKL